MNPIVRMLTTILILASNIALVGIWALNGYEHTWFYILLLLITIPTSWVHVIKKQ